MKQPEGIIRLSEAVGAELLSSSTPAEEEGYRKGLITATILLKSGIVNNPMELLPNAMAARSIYQAILEKRRELNVPEGYFSGGNTKGFDDLRQTISAMQRACDIPLPQKREVMTKSLALLDAIHARQESESKTKGFSLEDLINGVETPSAETKASSYKGMWD